MLDDYEQYAQPNWDGYGADPITAETLAMARTLANLFAIPPDTSPGADGGVCFEWVGSDSKVFLDVGPTSIHFYARIGDTLMIERTLTPSKRSDA
jgi:hypothetical protein